MASDDDLRQLLPLLDEQTEAPSTLVESVWADVESMLLDEPRPVVVQPQGHDSPRSGRGRTGVLLVAAAAVALVVGLAVIPRAIDSDVRPAQPLPSSDSVGPEATTAPTRTASVPTGPTLPEATTLADACAAFRVSLDEVAPLVVPGDGEFPQVAMVEAWIDATTELLPELQRLVDPVDTAELVSIQLMRTAMRAAVDATAAGNAGAARTAMANAVGHLDDAPSGCLVEVP